MQKPLPVQLHVPWGLFHFSCRVAPHSESWEASTPERARGLFLEVLRLTRILLSLPVALGLSPTGLVPAVLIWLSRRAHPYGMLCHISPAHLSAFKCWQDGGQV